MGLLFVGKRNLFETQNISISLLSSGADAPEQISSLAMDGDAVWAASGAHIIRYHRGKEVDTGLHSDQCPRKLTNLRIYE